MTPAQAGPWYYCVAGIMGSEGGGLVQSSIQSILGAINMIICTMPDEEIDQILNEDPSAKQGSNYNELVRLVGEANARKILEKSRQVEQYR